MRTIDKYKCDCDPEQIFKNGYETTYRTIILHPPIRIRKNCGDGNKKNIQIDLCLKEEIQELWLMGIETCGCCCGHNVSTGFIQVRDEYIKLMKKLGYRQYYYEGQQHERKDAFLPKTLYET